MMQLLHEDNINKWQSHCGLSDVIPNFLTTEYASAFATLDLNTMEIGAIEEFLMKLSSYNIFLKAEKGRVTARYKYINERLKRLLYIETQRLATVNKYMTKEEKEASAITQNSDICALKEEVMELEYKLDLIKDIPYAIDGKIDTIKTIYNRRIKEGKVEV